MAIELVDGFAGHPHISSEDLAALNKGTIGAKDCVFDYGDKFKCTMETANKAVIGTGAGMVGGLRFWSKSSTDLTVQSGSQGMKRHDLVVARYKKDSGTQIESVALEVVKGTPHASSPADPAVGADGMALWRIPIDGITPGAPVMVANVTPSIQALRDSVSHRYVVKTFGPFSGKAHYAQKVSITFADLGFSKAPEAFTHTSMGSIVTVLNDVTATSATLGFMPLIDTSQIWIELKFLER